MSAWVIESEVGQRGKVDHAVREQIIDAAYAHFRRNGFDKTAVSDLAKAIGFSKAYIYKFFDSKQAIGEAICAQTLQRQLASVEVAIARTNSATEQMRVLFSRLVTSSVEQFFQDRKLYDIAAHSSAENWPSTQAYRRQLTSMLASIVHHGRDRGEFERKTPLDEVCRSILLAMQSFTSPVLLQYNLDLVPAGPDEIVRLVLRSLAP